VAEDRKREGLAAYYAQLTEAQQTAVRAVAMGMCEPYIQAIGHGLPAGWPANGGSTRARVQRRINEAVHPQ
jgi:hypothetical protein